jgi:hypothetical protein
MWRSGENTRLLRQRCKHLCAWTCLLVLGLRVSMYNMYEFTKKKCIQVFIYPLSRIHNTSLISAYFGLDNRECKCLNTYCCNVLRTETLRSPQNYSSISLYLNQGEAYYIYLCFYKKSYLNLTNVVTDTLSRWGQYK